MTTDRIIYQSESLFVSGIKDSSTAITNAHISEINRVQDMSYNLEVSRTDINEFGQLAALSREVTEPPTVSLDFSYYLTDGTQESKLGFDLNSATSFPVTLPTPMTSNIIKGTTDKDELNYYIVTSPEGTDVHGGNLQDGNHGVIGIGNGFITSYGISAAVGELATASVSVEASNILFKSDLSGHNVENPAIDVNSTTGKKLTNKVVFATEATATSTSGSLGSITSSDGDITTGGSELFAIRPGDIIVDFDAAGYFDGSKSAGDLLTGGARLGGSGGSLGTGNTAVHVQSVSLDLPISRSALTRLGSHFPFKRKTDFPVTMTLNATALMTDFTDGSLDELICSSEQKRDIAIIMSDRCGNNQAMTYIMRNASMDTQAFTASIGDNKTVDITFSSQIGGSNDTENGVFLFAEPGQAMSLYGYGPGDVTETPKAAAITPV